MTDERPRVLVVGYAAYDSIMPVDGMPPEDTKVEVAAIHEGGGGPGATAAVALSRLGACVRFLGVLTDDAAGQHQCRELAEAGVDFSPSPVLTGHDSPRAIILVNRNGGERTIFWSRGDLPPLEPGLADLTLLDGIDLLYTDGHEAPTAVILAREARRRNIPVVMDAGSVREGSGELVATCTDVISSGIFAHDLTGVREPEAALRALAALGPSRVAMTLGERGVLGLVDGAPLRLSAFDVPVVDTTGAGDAFHAGYARALLAGADFSACLDHGQAVAALKCRDWGGRRGLPTLQEAEALLAAGPRRDP